ncbi:hypothetical protein KIN20_008936 [Parelaphostrongylus tenuis]|uniref:Uncharacterized protein n=1 Tax=Parelaphostrongylus tenuis TaxID=148309 RepID=A0AAD5QKV8_PARTN|nr:hypothetical protein KIN20_008936 [Parelaphostrongylus tenuis]
MVLPESLESSKMTLPRSECHTKVTPLERLPTKSFHEEMKVTGDILETILHKQIQKKPSEH